MQIEAKYKKLIHRAFEEQVKRTPEEIAISFNDEKLTYEQLNVKANNLAITLQSNSVKPGDVVGICMSRTPEMIIAIIAILKCGAAYLPIDAKNPVSRSLSFLNEAKVKAIVTNSIYDDELVENRINIDVSILSLTNVNNNNDIKQNLVREGDSEDKAYIMFTSGSTGGPKGVIVPHRAVYRLVVDTNYVEIKPSDNILHISQPAFDAATFEIWGALLNGAELVIYPDEILDPNVFASVVKQQNVTMMFLTSALFHLIASKYRDALKPLKTLLAGGDVLSTRVINNLLDAIPELTVIACYGPTENTTFTTTHTMNDKKRPGQSVPIGKVINGSGVHILDENQKPIAEGEIGELVATGAGVALGYVNKARNNSAFLINKEISENMIYRTGDLVRKNKDDVLDFIGRKDNQVKVRGFRMCLEEIQAPLLELDDVIDAFVTVQRHESGDQQLVAYIKLQTGSELNRINLRKKLASELPAYMIPDIVHLNAELFINKNGKIDKSRIEQALAC